MSESGRSNFLAVFLGVFAAVSFVGIVGMFLLSWTLNKSLEHMIDQLLSDTGGFFVPAEEFEGMEGVEAFDAEELGIVEEE